MVSSSTTASQLREGGNFRQGSFADRWEAARQLPRLGGVAIGDLITMLRDERLDWEDRWFAAYSLRHFDHPASIAALIDALGTADEDLQKTIIDTLGHLGPNAIQALSTLVTASATQAMAIEVLCRIPHPATQPLLVAAIDHTTGSTKASIIQALGQFADLDVLSLVVDALQDCTAAVRLAAIQSLISFRRQIGDLQWVALMQPLAKDIHPAVAQQAIYALGRTSHSAATQTLHELLTVSHTPVSLKLATVQALVWQDTPAAFEAIVQSWDMLSDAIRVTALQALSRTTNPSLQLRLVIQVPQWLDALPTTADRSLLRRHLVMLLGQWGDRRAIPILQALTQDEDAGVRLHAAAALRHHHP
ncbi:HEAT repeat domain-containing protein [Leptolyngbya sp. BL0902]|uniref:HEAT repeat domain-containing protein n=1 Tax=Leptolyngbya sp. BL0902 TaxID=1115757 RepID=UPI0018E88BF3|nr:HEAT repeat domain-containing protein [Leptolyngbya sp. BL0902]